MVGLAEFVIASAESSRRKLKLISCLHELSNLNSYEHLIESLIILEHRY